MKEKGFSMLEVIMVIALMGIVVGIGVPSITGINFRANVKADKILGGEIGTAIMQLDMSKGILQKNEPQQLCSGIVGLEKYVDKTAKPEAMKEGQYVVGKREVNNQSVLLIGITKDGTDIGGTAIYDGKNIGWVWSSKGDIEDFMDKYGSEL